MHVRVKKQLLNIVERLQKLHANFAGKDGAELGDALAMCQQAAIDVGESIEKYVGEGLEVVHLLETYCEKLFNISQSLHVSESVIEELTGIMADVQTDIEGFDAKYRVVFLPYKADMWDSLESIWRAFDKDERFECDVVPIPYFEANQQEKKWESRYDGNRFPQYVRVVNYEYYRLEEMQPDIAFIHNPFDNCNYVTSVHPAYYSDELKKYVSKLVYVPYYVNTGFISTTYQQLPLFSRMDYMVVQSETAKETCSGTSFYNRILPFGSPKLDRVIRMNEQGADIPDEWQEVLYGKKRLMLNTTINDLLYNEDVLLDKLQDFFENIAKKNEVVIVWRPHPLLESTVKAMRPALLEKYNNLVKYFNENNVGIFDTTGDITNTVVMTDGYIGSGYSSVVNLFSVCGKPVFLFDSQNIYDIYSDEKVRKSADEVFCKPENGYYFACFESKEYTIGDFIDDLVNDRLNEVRKRQMELVRDLAANLDGTCGEKVYEYIAKVIVDEYGI